MTRAKFWLITIAALAVAFFCVAYPLYVIWPFRQQHPRQLAAALEVIRIRSFVTWLCAAAAVTAIVLYWRTRPRVLAKIGAVVAVVGVCLFTALSQINIYEIMFHPMVRPTFAAAKDSKLDGAEMVLAVHEGAAERAYPIRIVSYHHVVNDVIGGAAIAATY